MTAICPVCGKEFTASVEGHAGRTKLCCSSACKQRRRNRTQKGQPVAETEYRAFCEKRKAARLAKRQRVCPVCGKAFVADAAHPGAKYCTIACSNRARAGSKPAAKPNAVPGEPLASLARVRAYLALPPAERYARRGELTKAEHALAQKIYMENHSIRTVATNDLAH